MKETTPAAAIDTAAAQRLWAEYAAARPDAVRLCADYTVERFGDSARLADELLREVIRGLKRATSELASEFAARGESLPRVGSHWIVCDGSGVPQVVLRSVELRLGTFDSVDDACAWDEGEDDRTLARWRTDHRKYWMRGWAVRG